MQLIWNRGAVNEDAALVPEDAPLDKNFSLASARDKLRCKLLEQDHVSVKYRGHEAQVHDLTIPLSPLVLSKDGFDEDSSMVTAVSESEAFQDGGQVGTHAALCNCVSNLNCSLATVIDKLLELRLVEFQDAVFGHTEVSLKLELVLVHFFTVDLLEVKPVLNSSELMIRQCCDDSIDRREVHLVRASKHLLCALLLCLIVHCHAVEVLLCLRDELILFF